MDDGFYPSLEVEERQPLFLQDLGRQCAVLEEELRAVAKTLPARQRAVVEDYITFRDTLEVESIRAAIRFGERQAKRRIGNE